MPQTRRKATTRDGGNRGKGQEVKKRGIEQFGDEAPEDFLNLDGDVISKDDSDTGLEEEDVMELKLDEADQEDYHESSEDEMSDAGMAAARAPQKGWRPDDFYSAADGGRDSSTESDEEGILEEVRQLEKARARRLRHADDVLDALLGPDDALPDVSRDRVQTNETDASSQRAQFEAVFAAKAERSTVARNDTPLPDVKKRDLVKKEAPELLPLIKDFMRKMEEFRKLAPLLSKPVPVSGAVYLRAKASLLLSTLANLSFYLLARSEGEGIRAHPVVSQLVWLHELHELIAPLDKRLRVKLQRALRITSVTRESSQVDAGVPTSLESKPEITFDPTANVSIPKSKKKLSIRERVQRTIALEATPENGSIVGTYQTPDSLLKLPKRVPTAGKETDRLLDLDEWNPSLGAWQPKNVSLPGTTKQEATLGSADRDVNPMSRQATRSTGPGTEAPATLASLPKGKQEAKRRAMKDAAKQKKRLEHLAKQFKPDKVLIGRRKSSDAILKNRGLVRPRKPGSGNARLKNRKKYESAVKRHSGAVQPMREAPDEYTGEATGIRTHLKKSQKLDRS